jgi:glycosyltransferase involved in cell wall biosynthesis
MTHRILHFAEDSDTSGFFPQLARHHNRARYEMMFATLKPMAPWLKEYMESQDVRTLSLDCTSRGQYPLAIIRFARTLRHERIDLLHTHLFDPSVVGLAAGVLAGTRVRIVTRHYSDYHTRIHKRWHVKLDQFCTWAAHAVIAVSQHTARHLTDIEDAPPEKVRAIPNGIDLDRVRISSSEAPARLRHEYAADGRALLICAGRLHPEKGYEQLFAAMPEVARRCHRRVRLLIAGTGALEPEYKARVEAAGCADVITFLGFRRDLPDLIAAADLFVLPSMAEAFGLALAEALYLGTPVVSTTVGGIPEIVTDGVDGILIPPGDVDALTQAVCGLLDDSARRLAMRNRGRDSMARRFRFDDMLRAYEAVYQDALSRNS